MAKDKEQKQDAKPKGGDKGDNKGMPQQKQAAPKQGKKDAPKARVALSDAPRAIWDVVSLQNPSLAMALSHDAGEQLIDGATAFATGTVPAECQLSAAFVADVSVPDGTAFKPNEAIRKTWRVRIARSAAVTGSAGSRLTSNWPGEPSSLKASQGMPSRPSSPIFLMLAQGNSALASSSAATGATSLRANSRTMLRTAVSNASLA